MVIADSTSTSAGAGQGRAGPGKAWTGDAAKLSLGACMTPKPVVFEAVIYPNKARQWFC